MKNNDDIDKIPNISELSNEELSRHLCSFVEDAPFLVKKRKCQNAGVVCRSWDDVDEFEAGLTESNTANRPQEKARVKYPSRPFSKQSPLKRPFSNQSPLKRPFSNQSPLKRPFSTQSPNSPQTSGVWEVYSNRSNKWMKLPVDTQKKLEDSFSKNKDRLDTDTHVYDLRHNLQTRRRNSKTSKIRRRRIVSATNLPPVKIPILPSSPVPFPSAFTNAAANKIAVKKINDAKMRALVRKFKGASSYGSPQNINQIKIVEGMILKRIWKRVEPNSKYSNELKLARELSTHPNVIDVFGTIEEGGFGYICMELGTPSYDSPNHTNLRDVTFCKKHGLSAKDIFCAVVCCLSAGLNHVHQFGFNVADVKLKNTVFFDVGSKIKLKLIDFGNAVARTNAHTSKGNPWGSPPEHYMGHLGHHFGLSLDEQEKAFGNTRMDEFLFGCMLLDILTWKKGYSRDQSYCFESFYEVSLPNRFYPNLVPRTCPKMGVDWLDSLVSLRPSKRFSMQQISSIPEHKIRDDFEALVLPFNMNYENLRYKDDANVLCMRPMGDAY